MYVNDFDGSVVFGVLLEGAMSSTFTVIQLPSSRLLPLVGVKVHDPQLGVSDMRHESFEPGCPMLPTSKEPVRVFPAGTSVHESVPSQVRSGME